jgi:hypothetical protein
VEQDVRTLADSEKKTLQDAAHELGVPVPWLAGLIEFESAGSWNPAIRNRTSGATGLIQFMPRTAMSLGTTVQRMARMGFESQMKYVVKYLLPHKPFPSRQSLLMAVFYPVAKTWPPETEFPEIVQRYNPGIDTVQDYLDHVDERIDHVNWADWLA